VPSVQLICFPAAFTAFKGNLGNIGDGLVPPEERAALIRIVKTTERLSLLVYMTGALTGRSVVCFVGIGNMTALCLDISLSPMAKATWRGEG
jgi:hypothetical protein